MSTPSSPARRAGWPPRWPPAGARRVPLATGTTTTPSSSARGVAGRHRRAQHHRHVDRPGARLHRALARHVLRPHGEARCSAAVSRTPASMTRARTPRAISDVASGSPNISRATGAVLVTTSVAGPAHLDRGVDHQVVAGMARHGDGRAASRAPCWMARCRPANLAPDGFVHGGGAERAEGVDDGRVGPVDGAHHRWRASPRLPRRPRTAGRSPVSPVPGPAPPGGAGAPSVGLVDLGAGVVVEPRPRGSGGCRRSGGRSRGRCCTRAHHLGPEQDVVGRHDRQQAVDAGLVVAQVSNQRCRQSAPRRGLPMSWASPGTVPSSRAPRRREG